MSSEILSVSEDDLVDVVMVIRAGLNEVVVEDHVAEGLESWCEEMEQYIQDLAEED